MMTSVIADYVSHCFNRNSLLKDIPFYNSKKAIWVPRTFRLDAFENFWTIWDYKLSQIVSKVP